MPPGSPADPQKKGLPTWALVLMILGGLIAAGFLTCVVAGGAAVYWLKGQAEGATEALKNGQSEGIAFGTGKSDKACAAEIVRRAESCNLEQFDFACIQTENGFILGCWQSSGTPDWFCERSEQFGDFEAVGETHRQRCQYFGIEDTVQCARLMAANQTFCWLSQAAPGDLGTVKSASPLPPTAPVGGQ